MIDPGLYMSTKSDIFWVTPRRTLPTAFKLFTGWYSIFHLICLLIMLLKYCTHVSVLTTGICIFLFGHFGVKLAHKLAESVFVNSLTSFNQRRGVCKKGVLLHILLLKEEILYFGFGQISVSTKFELMSQVLIKVK